MRDIRNLSAVGAVVLVILLLITAMGLAVPSITVNVQSLGGGDCSLLDFLDSANVTVGWNITQSYYWYLSNYTLNNITIYFSNNVSLASTLIVKMSIYGYNTNSGQYEEDNFSYIVHNVSITAGVPYLIKNTNSTFSYYAGLILTKPRITSFKIVVFSNGARCNNNKISLGIQGVEVGSSEYAPNNPGEFNISVIERSGSYLYDYVINFSLPGNWTGRYPVITDENGSRLKYWYDYVPTSQKTWFWVSLNLTPYENTTLHFYYGNETLYDPLYVTLSTFWFYQNSSFSLSAGESASFNSTAFSIFESLLQGYGYDGYSVDTKANLSVSSTTSYDPYFLAYNLSLLDIPLGEGLRLYTTGVERLDAVYQGNGRIRFLTRVNYTSLPVGAWAVYRIILTSDGDILTFFNGMLFGNYSLSSLSWAGLVYMPFTLGQYNAGTSYYSWIGFRPYKYPEPLVILNGVNTGDYTFTVYFRP